MKNILLPLSAMTCLRASCVLVLLPAVVSAQRLEELQPAPVPPQVEAPAAAVTLAPPAEQAGAALALPQDDQVLVESLRGVAFFPSADDASGAEVEEGMRFTSLQLLDTPVFRGVIGSYMVQPVTRTLLMQLTTATQLYLAQLGYPFSVAYLPEQDITDGVVRVVVVLSRMESELKIEGAKYFSPGQYRAKVRLDPDAPMNAEALRQDVAWINRNPFRSASVEARPGSEPGTTQLLLKVREVPPWRVFGGYNNTGTRTTTEDRVNGGINWGNAFWLGHLMTLQWTSDLEARYSRSVSGNYVAHLRRDQTVTVFGAYSEIESVPNGGLSQTGMSWQAGMNYDIPLLPIGTRYTQSLQFGADFKVSDNNLEFAQPPFVFPISDTLTHIAQLRVEYQGTLSDRWGSTTATLKLTGAPGNLSSENDDTAFEATRSGSDATYAYVNLDLTRITRLPGLPEGWTWTVRGAVQLASRNLLGSEQFSGGGTGSVRGYAQGEVVGDNALLFSQELAAPPLKLASRFTGGRVNDSLGLYGFHDYARLWSVAPLAGELPFNLHSVGLGLRWQITRYGSVQAAYGWQLRDSGSNDTGKDSRLHFSANLSF